MIHRGAEDMWVEKDEGERERERGTREGEKERRMQKMDGERERETY